MNVISREPAVSAGVVSAVASIAAGLGLNWPPAVIGAALAGLSLLLSVLVRTRVTPVTPPADPPREHPFP